MPEFALASSSVVELLDFIAPPLFIAFLGRANPYLALILLSVDRASSLLSAVQ